MSPQADIEDRMLGKMLGQAAEQQSVQIEAQQGGVIALGLLGQMVGDGTDQFLQAEHEQVRQLRLHLIVVLLIAHQLTPVALQSVQRRAQGGWRGTAQAVQTLLVQPALPG